MVSTEDVDGSVATGDFASWVRANWTQIVGIGRVVTADPSLVDDVIQDCLVDLHRHWDRLQDEGASPLAYAARVMGSKAANYRRTAWARRVRLTDDVWALDGTVGDNPDRNDPAGDVTDRIAVGEALRQLSARQRQVVAMHYLLDMPVAQIAVALDRPIGSVTSDLSRARTRLRRGLGVGGDDAHG